MPALSNHLIELLPRADRKRLLAICEPVEMVLSDVLQQPDAPTTHVYFPTSGFVSLIALVDAASGVEVGMVGAEGMVGAYLALGVDTAPQRALVQGAGHAWRIDSRAFTIELERSAPLRQVMNRYLYVLMTQLGASATCLRFHLIGPRLARWLLMSQDRAGSASFHMTHEFLSYMLGVRRVGITAAAGILQESGAISYHRGDCKVIDRVALEAAACSCYAGDLRAYTHQFEKSDKPAL